MWAFTCIDVYPNKIWERRICGYFLFFSHYLGQYCRQESWPSRLESSVCRLFLINHDMVYMFFFLVVIRFCCTDELEQLIFLNLAMQLFSWGSSSQSPSSGGQWGVRLSQPWLFDRLDLLFLSEVSDLMTWQSCRPASSTRWLCWKNCTYFRWLWRHLLFLVSLAQLDTLVLLLRSPWPSKILLDEASAL